MAHGSIIWLYILQVHACLKNCNPTHWQDAWGSYLLPIRCQACDLEWQGSSSSQCTWVSLDRPVFIDDKQRSGYDDVHILAGTLLDVRSSFRAGRIKSHSTDLCVWLGCLRFLMPMRTTQHDWPSCDSVAGNACLSLHPMSIARPETDNLILIDDLRSWELFKMPNTGPCCVSCKK